MALTSRLAIIAGGLGGIGSATGRLLRSKGAHLAILYAPFEAPHAQEILASAYGGPDGILAYECDITSRDSVAQAFAALARDLAAAPAPAPFPSILVNAAGIVVMTPMEDTPIEELQDHLNVNLVGPFLVSQAFARLYFATRLEAENAGAGVVVPPGRIVSIASQAAHIALPAHSAYTASKAGLIGLTKAMAFEWAPRGINSNTVSPGPVMTTMGQKAWADPKRREEYLALVPARKFAEPEEVAAAISYLCEDTSASVNGEDIKVEGGFVISGV